MELPVAFLEKYKKILGEDFENFEKSFSESAVSAFRINPLKNLDFTFENIADELVSNIEVTDEKRNSFEKISASHFGYYGKLSGKSIEYVTGLVYSQEPAAQVVGEVAHPKKGMKVLDLCAAPGGKSTHLLSFLENDGLLVSNEISPKRSKILVENIERFGARNVVVLNERSERLAKVFPEFFDLIVLDAPCSGEGMFRKDPEAITYWSEDYPVKCAKLQREIIEQALKMLAAGGHLVYSTCTWSPEENEDNVRWILENYSDLELSNIPKMTGWSSGIDMPEVVRCWPQHFRGEGQFVAHLVKKANATSKKQIKSGKTNLNREQIKLWTEFSEKYLLTNSQESSIFTDGTLQVFGENLYLLPKGLPDLTSLKIARNGLHLGTFKKNRFEPSFALGIVLKPEEVTQSLEISNDDFKKIVAGETISPKFTSKEQAINNGWVQLTIRKNGLGFGKMVNGTVKNHFPKGLRFLS